MPRAGAFLGSELPEGLTATVCPKCYCPNLWTGLEPSPRASCRVRGNSLKWMGRVLPITVTVIALGVALDRFNLRQLWSTAAQLSGWALGLVVLELLGGSLLASLRLKALAEGVHHTLKFGDAVLATTSGNLAGSFFFQVVGQTIARSAVLSKVGISLPTTIVIAGYERLIAAALSFSIALGGAFSLFHRITFDLTGGGLNLLTILAGLIAVAVAGCVFAWGDKAKKALRAGLTAQKAEMCFRAAVITLLIQATTMAAYLAAATSLSPSTPISKLVAATALVMFAASVPISLAGWGLREVSAIYALGAIGVPNQVSLVVALLIGFSSIIVTAIVALVSSQLVSRRPSRSAKLTPPISAAASAHASFLNWFIPLFAASAVFFQVWVPVDRGLLNINLADSVILFGGALFALRALSRRLPPLAPRATGLWFSVALMSAVVILAFIHGLFVFGWTSWAFTNRLFGWLVLLSYASTGALLAIDTDANGFQTLLRTFVASGLAVVACELALLFGVAFGAPIPQTILPWRIDGFAQNPNAFGFQLLLVIAAIIALRLTGWRQCVALGLAFIGIYLTASRAAEGTAVIVCAAAIWLGYVSARQLALSLAYAVVGMGVIILSGFVPGLIYDAINSPAHALASTVFHGLPRAGHNAVATYFSVNIYQLTTGDPGAGLNADRWQSLIGGFRMFLAHPIFGAGLGAFVHSFAQQHGRFLPIHSTPIWLLAETGIVGFLVFAVPTVLVLYREVHRSLTSKKCNPGGTLLVLALISFGVMSQVHELLYQRMLWLILGAAIFAPELQVSEANMMSSAEVPIEAGDEEPIAAAVTRG